MEKSWVNTLSIGYNSSGAAQAASLGNVIVIVDVIDMSTTAEAAMEAGAIRVMGASPADISVPVKVNPEKIGYIAGRQSLKAREGVIVAAEPRLMTDNCHKLRLNRIKQVEKGIKKAGADLFKIIPNLGKEVADLADFNKRVVVIVSPAGGAAYDAAYNAGARQVITGTVARTRNIYGEKPMTIAAKRAIYFAQKHKTGITIVAASSNSMEDILAAESISKEIIKYGFLRSGSKAK